MVPSEEKKYAFAAFDSYGRWTVGQKQSDASSLSLHFIFQSLPLNIFKVLGYGSKKQMLKLDLQTELVKSIVYNA